MAMATALVLTDKQATTTSTPPFTNAAARVEGPGMERMWAGLRVEMDEKEKGMDEYCQINWMKADRMKVKGSLGSRGLWGRQYGTFRFGTISVKKHYFIKFKFLIV